MTSPTQESQAQETKPSDKELNFRALEAKFQKQLEQERSARLETERAFQEALSNKNRHQEDEDDDSEPYVDHKKLNKTLSLFEKKLEEKMEKKAEEKARILLEKEKQESWVRQNPDFYQTMQLADKFAERNPELAETILNMPEGFERQKLVYKNIKALGLDKPEQKVPSIQEKIDANKKSPYYQPSGMGSAPYAPVGDFSPTGQKAAYEKMKELKARLRV